MYGSLRNEDIKVLSGSIMMQHNESTAILKVKFRVGINNVADVGI